MRVFFRPALALMNHLSLAGVLVTGTLLCLLPQFMALSILFSEGGVNSGARVSAPSLFEATGGTAGVMIGSMLLGAYFLSAIYLRVKGDLVRFGETMERIASGDLTAGARAHSAEMERAENSEDGHLWRSIGLMNKSLIEIVDQVRTSADAIVSVSREISAGNRHLSRRTEEQAAALEQTAAGMEEFAATVKRNTLTCQRAHAAAADASQVAGNAAAHIREMIRTMGTIEQTSHSVAEIVGVIEGIAFQINILALNAAVEAAHAGSQGRGFAVIASEVRNLARHSASSAKEIKALIGVSVAQITQGTRLVADSGSTIEEVAGRAKEVSEMISQIAAASTEQSAGIEEVNKAMLQLDSMTQQNAALVEEATAAALAFGEETSRLVDVVAAFKVDHVEARDEAVALVKKAVAHIQAIGLKQACNDFENPDGGFISGEYYVYVDDLQGRRLSYAANPALRGENVLDLRDANGKPFMREIVEIATTKGKGWCDYYWENPSSGAVESKSAYIERVGNENAFVACGIYKQAAKTEAKLGRAPPPKKAVSLPAHLPHIHA